MSLYLPPELRWLGWIAGAQWPDGDEDKAWAVAAAWQDAADELFALLAQVDKAEQATMSAYSAGAARAEMGARYDLLRSGDQSLEQLATSMAAQYGSTFDMGTELQATKLTIIVTLCWLAVEIAWAWLFPPTAPAVEAAAIASTRSYLKVIQDFVQKTIQNLAQRAGAAAGPRAKRHFWKQLAKGHPTWPTAKGWGVYGARAVEGAVVPMAINGSIQAGQIADGKRRSFNGKEFGLSALGGAAGAVPAREFGRYLGEGIEKVAGKYLNNVGGRAANGMFIGAMADGFGAVFGNLATAVVAGDFSAFSNGPGWVGNFAQGGLVGGVRGASAFNSYVPKTTDGFTDMSAFRKDNWLRGNAWRFPKYAGPGLFAVGPDSKFVVGSGGNTAPVARSGGTTGGLGGTGGGTGGEFGSRSGETGGGLGATVGGSYGAAGATGGGLGIATDGPAGPAVGGPSFEGGQTPNWQSMPQSQWFTTDVDTSNFGGNYSATGTVDGVGSFPGHGGGLGSAPLPPGSFDPAFDTTRVDTDAGSAIDRPVSPLHESEMGSVTDGPIGPIGSVSSYDGITAASPPAPVAQQTPLPGAQQAPLPGGQQAPIPGGQQAPLPGGQQAPIPGGQQSQTVPNFSRPLPPPPVAPIGATTPGGGPIATPPQAPQPMDRTTFTSQTSQISAAPQQFGSNATGSQQAQGAPPVPERSPLRPPVGEGVPPVPERSPLRPPVGGPTEEGAPPPPTRRPPPPPVDTEGESRSSSPRSDSDSDGGSGRSPGRDGAERDAHRQWLGEQVARLRQHDGELREQQQRRQQLADLRSLQQHQDRRSVGQRELERQQAQADLLRQRVDRLQARHDQDTAAPDRRQPPDQMNRQRDELGRERDALERQQQHVDRLRHQVQRERWLETQLGLLRETADHTPAREGPQVRAHADRLRRELDAIRQDQFDRMPLEHARHEQQLQWEREQRQLAMDRLQTEIDRTLRQQWDRVPAGQLGDGDRSRPPLMWQVLGVPPNSVPHYQAAQAWFAENRDHHFIGEGKDLRGKPRPQRWPVRPGPIDEFRAPNIAGDGWLPVGAVPPEGDPDDQPPDDRPPKPPVIHPDAVVDPGATVGPGARIDAGAVVADGAVIGAGAVLHAGAVVQPGATIGDGAEIGPGVVVHDGAVVGAGAVVHEGAVILPGTVVPDGAVVDAGEVVGGGAEPGNGSKVDVPFTLK